ncbi:hypothetical protein NKH18_45135 [Streptomyces sp. M10(2022)]
MESLYPQAWHLHYPSEADRALIGQAYTNLRAGYGLRGGSPDTGVEPYGARWPIGRRVILEGPRAVMAPDGSDAGRRVPLSEVPVSVSAKGSPRSGGSPISG